MDESRAESLVATDDKGKMLVTLLKTVLTNCALKIDDATGQLLVDLHDQATAAERDKLQSSLEDLTRDHNAAKAKNDELTDKLAKLEQNHPDAELPRLLEEMENDLAKWRSRGRAWQDQLEKKDAYIQSLRSELDNETRQHKVTRRLRALY
ncbi:hypothetical protein SMACR_09522 [Sordaria macrospora]|uniref:WGS project CABT00000000 data, contig 2.54 n=2 Tax=Sordaria macrospora TaxID=5147 RepID=F7W9P7_SORMK|nr:uncharacterized protein SMAC_09522 [Sordaria macrospora k-hell]KAA8632189.1 hypothetical protein SMACR_09522 [Sordaria macrospora]WPJ57145.1 hypothetical protein SMAC4_09522 [Sordaria macrospora]CCC14038.1 unnamed protein product [Sordaria macrospora k-hell]